MATPLLSDLQPTKTKFKAGDRVLVRLADSLTPSQVDKIRKAVRKFCGEEVRILLVDCLKVKMWHSPKGSPTYVLVDASYKPSTSGVAHLDCAVVEFNKDDRLLVEVQKMPPEWWRGEVKRWVGPDVELILWERPC